MLITLAPGSAKNILPSMNVFEELFVLLFGSNL
jgi:hypothetical protein